VENIFLCSNNKIDVKNKSTVHIAKLDIEKPYFGVLCEIRQHNRSSSSLSRPSAGMHITPNFL